MKKLFILLFTTVIIGLSSSAQSILYEGFENALLPPTGWVATSDCDYSNWYGWLLSQTAHTGNNSAYIPFAPFSYTHDSYLITPQLAITGHMILSFCTRQTFLISVPRPPLPWKFPPLGRTLKISP